MTGIGDFHTHVLPEIDDGSASVKESVAMLWLHIGEAVYFFRGVGELGFLPKMRPLN